MILLHYFSSLGLGINLPVHASCEDLISAEGGVLLPPRILFPASAEVGELSCPRVLFPVLLRHLTQLTVLDNVKENWRKVSLFPSLCIR